MPETDYKQKAVDEVTAANPDGSDFKVHNVYDNVMDGVLVDVGFQTKGGVWATNHVFIGQHLSVYRSFHDVCAAVSAYKESSFFFRLLKMTGVGGLIALFLIGLFSILLFGLALSNVKPNEGIIDIIKLSFAVVLGYFFGNQVGRS